MRYHNLSELRLFFALCVVISHSVILAGLSEYNVLRAIFSSDTAVQAFFILSGFLVLVSYEQSPNIADFYKRRGLRIFPAYVLVVFFFLGLGILQALTKDTSVALNEIYRYLIANLALLNFIKPGVSGVFSSNLYQEINGALWSIKVEVGFYVLVPAIYWLGRRKSFLLVAILMIGIGLLWGPSLILVEKGFEWKVHPSLNHQLPGQLQFFGLGILLYCVSRNPDDKLPVLLVILGAMIMAILLGQTRMGWQMLMLSALIYTAINLPQIRSPFVKLDLSYGVYLAHFPIIQLLVSLRTWSGHEIEFFGLVLLLASLYAWLSWTYVERPAIGLMKRGAT